MNSAVVTLNDWARQWLAFAWPVFWQSGLLIALIFGLEFGLRRKLRAAVRYALWLVILLKLLLPPSLALPSGVGWWVRPSARKPQIHKETAVVVSYRSDWTDTVEMPKLTAAPEGRPALSLGALSFLAWAGVGCGLLAWMLIRWRGVAQAASGAAAAPDWLEAQLREARAVFGCRRRVELRVLERSESPALSGLFRPILLVPRKLVEQLVPAEMRAVLLHELIHLRRGDVWVNCTQAVLQILYWWHPLLWLANARIRRVREEAVDDAVMLALRNDSDSYAPTLLAVARLAMKRPAVSLGLVGIFESHTSLRQRIERLVDFQPPARAGLTLASLVSVVAFAAVALPMGQAPASPERDLKAAVSTDNPWPDPRFQGYAEIKLEPKFLIADEASLRAVLPGLVDAQTPLVFDSNQVAEVESRLQQANAQPYTSAEPLTFAKFSGGTFTWLIGGVTNNGVNYLTRNAGEQRTIVIGAETQFSAIQPDWFPLELTVVPWSEDSSVRCQVELGFTGKLNSMKQTGATVPLAGALLWAAVTESSPRKYEIILLEEKSGVPNEEGPGSESKVGSATENSSRSTAATNAANFNSPGAAPVATGIDATPPTDLATLRRFLTNSAVSNAFSASTNRTPTNNKEIDPHSPVPSWKLKGIFTKDAGEAMAIINQRSYHLGDEIQGYKIIRITGEEVWFQGPCDKERLGFDRVQSGKELSERGELSQAGAQFEKALEEDPANQAAQYYLDQVRRAIYRKLGDTRLGTVSFDHTPLREVLDTLSSYTQDRKSGNKTINLEYSQEPDDIGQVRITIQPPLTDVSLLQVIEAVTKVAPTPLKYSLTSSGVVFARRSGEPVALYTRIIKVDPETFIRNLRSANGSYKNGAPAQAEVREFFVASGVDLSPPKTIFFNDREGTLLVRTTLGELDKVERSVLELNKQKSQINIKTKFVTVPVEFAAPFWRVMGWTNSPDSSAAGVSAVLTPAQTAVLTKAFEASSGVDVSEGSVTTLSGREAQIQMVELKTIVTNINPRALAPPGISSKESKSDLYQMATVPFGPLMNIVALVQDDGQHLQLVAGVELTEFLSYGDFTNEVPIYIEGRRYSTAWPSPHSRLGKAAANVVVADGQTLVFAAEMLDEPGSSAPASKSNKRWVLALVTPVIIDPAGNPLHPEVSRQTDSAK